MDVLWRPLAPPVVVARLVSHPGQPGGSGCAGFQAGTRTAAQDRPDTHSGHSRVARGTYAAPAQLSVRGQCCKQRTNALKIAGGSLREEGVKMSWNVPGWIPGVPIKDDTPPCARCGHRADSHLSTGFCSVRGRWRRRCRCSVRRSAAGMASLSRTRQAGGVVQRRRTTGNEWPRAGSTADLLLFTIKDHCPGRAVLVWIPARCPAATCDRRGYTSMYETTGQVYPRAGDADHGPPDANSWRRGHSWSLARISVR